MVRLRAVTVGLFVAVVAAGCGGGDDASPTTEKPVRSSNDSSSEVRTSEQVCELVSSSEAVTAVDEMVTPSPGGPGLPSCTWSAGEGDGPSLRIQFDRGAVAYDAFDRGIKSGGIPVSKGAPAEGVGDAAYWDFSAGPDQPSLRVRSGEDAFVVTIVNPAFSDDQVRASSTTVAESVVGKLL